MLIHFVVDLKGAERSQEEECCSADATICWRGKE